MEPKNLKVGSILWDKDRGYPIIISYVNRENNCFRWICLSDNTETENIPIIRQGEPNRILEYMVPSTEQKIREYFANRKNAALKKMHESLGKLHEVQRQHDNAVQKLNDEFTLEKHVNITLEKFYKKLPKE